MKIKTGIDLVYLPRYKKAMQRGGENFLRRVFLEKELPRHLPGEQTRHLEGSQGDTQHLAGIFALKEAVIKALSLKPGSWLDIKVSDRSDGLPQVTLFYSSIKIINYSSSLSHDGDYIVAQYTALVEEQN